MSLGRVVLVVSLAALCAPCSYAAGGRLYSELNENLKDTNGDGNPDPFFSAAAYSSSALPDAPSAVADRGTSSFYSGPSTRLQLATRPFSAIAVALRMGIGGIGFDVATPLATKINLRISTSFFAYNPSVTEDGFPIDGKLKLATVGAGIDLYPYHNTFHITPGVTIYNGNHASATTAIAGGQMFSVNDTQYQSAMTDPVHGTFDVNMGRRFAPSLTVGFGNMLRRESHWSFPVDFGFEYVGTPKFTLNMQGSVCDPEDGCTPIQSDPDTMQNLATEQANVNKSIAPLRFYPIVSGGVSYRFGHNVSLAAWR